MLDTRQRKKARLWLCSLGYSHPVEMEDPEGITTEVSICDMKLSLKVSIKHLVGNYAANISNMETA